MYTPLTKTFAVLATMALMLLSCAEMPLKPAEVIIIDPIRHYYPVIQGEMMGITFEMENVSDNALFIQEVQTTCGCLVLRDELPIIILPHKRGQVHLEFNTIKNNGYVEHFVYCYGNFKDTTAVEMSFDTNVVPRGSNFRDYEEMWAEQSGSTLHDIVDGTSGQKGYYTDSGTGQRQEEEQQQE